jgi:uncharacterized surface protein with fasciclin (FAS1) repeats
MRRTRVGAAMLGSALLLSGCAADATDGAEPGGTRGPIIGDERGAEPGGTRGPIIGDDRGAEPGSTDAADGSTVLEVAASDPQFSTFVQAVEAAGLEQTIALPGPITVFAPTNEAFEALPDGLLDELLKPANKEPLTFIVSYHVVEDEITSDDLDGEVTALSGQKLELSGAEGGSVNGVAVVQADIESSNGVVHAIDEVLVPPDVDPEALLAQ